MYEYDKGQLRRLALSKRNELDEAYRMQAGEIIGERILNHPAVKAAQTIMCYMSFRSEVPTLRLVQELENQGKKLCFPVCGKSGIMQAWHPQNKSAWKVGMMGICEPDVEKSELVDPEEIDVVICPVVAFDDSGRRMGYGGGYYDRYLPQCSKALRIGIAFEAQRLEKIITDDYDQPMDVIITDI